MPLHEAPTLHDSAPGDRALLRLLQAGGLLVVVVVAPLEAIDLDRFLVPKELAVHLLAALAGGLAFRRRHRLRTTWIDGLLVAFLAVSGLSAIQAVNPWLALRALALSASGVVLFWAARSLPPALKPPLRASLALAVVVAVALALLQAYGVESPFFSDKRVPGGTLGNRNFVGHWAAIGLPMLVLVALQATRGVGVLGAALGIPLLTAVWILTRSRAAWIAVLAVLGVLVAGVVVRPALRGRKRRLLVLLVAAAGGLGAALALPNALQWSSDSPYLDTARSVLDYQQGSGRGRLVQYRTSLRMAAAHPLLGVGPGNWPVAYLDHAAPNDPSRDWSQPGMTANPWPSSDWVALVSERGAPALLLILLAGLGLAFRAARRLLSAPEPADALAALALLATLAGAAAIGAFDALLLLAWPTLYLALALGSLEPGEAGEPGQPPRRRGGALLLASLLALLGAVHSSGQLAALVLYETGDRDALVWAARLDPGSYRAHLRLAQRGADGREARCRHARAAHQLYPHAEAARQLARRCP